MKKEKMLKAFDKTAELLKDVDRIADRAVAKIYKKLRKHEAHYDQNGTLWVQLRYEELPDKAIPQFVQKMQDLGINAIFSREIKPNGRYRMVILSKLND